MASKKTQPKKKTAKASAPVKAQYRVDTTLNQNITMERFRRQSKLDELFNALVCVAGDADRLLQHQTVEGPGSLKTELELKNLELHLADLKKMLSR